MKTISRKIFQPAQSFLAVFLCLTCLSLPAAIRNGLKSPRRFLIGVAAGCFYPQQETFREIYGHGVWPVELQLDWEVFRNFSIVGAARYLETSGTSVSLFPQLPAETYDLHWQMATLRLGVNYRHGRSRFAPFVGLGGSFSFYREQWRDIDLYQEGQKAGFFFQAGGRFRLNRFWQVLGQLDYSVIPGGIGPQGQVRLGGVTLLLGLLARIF